MTKLDISSNRSAIKYSKTELIQRVLWSFALPFFHYSPRPLFGWRRFILRCFGAKIGREVNIYASAKIYMPWNLEVGDFSAIGEHAYIYNLGKITIGESSTISQRAHLCAGTHDYNEVNLPLRKPEINVGSQCWICADAFIGPGINVGHGAIVGARAVAMRSIDEWTIVVGNPAKVIKVRELR